MNYDFVFLSICLGITVIALASVIATDRNRHDNECVKLYDKIDDLKKSLTKEMSDHFRTKSELREHQDAKAKRLANLRNNKPK